MDVTYTNVLQGARQYFQGIPSSSNTTVRISNLPEAHCPIPSNKNQEVSPSDQFWPVHLNASRIQTINHSPVRQQVAHIPNSGNQLHHLQYNKERVEQGYSQYKTPYNAKNELGQEQQLQFRQVRMPHIEHGDQERQPQQRICLQQSHHQQQRMYFQQQPKHQLQKQDYQYLHQQGKQHEFQYQRLHLTEQTQSNPSSPYPQTSYHQSQEQLKTHFYPKGPSVTHTPHEDALAYPVSSEEPSTPCYPMQYGELKKYSWPRTYCPNKSLEKSDNTTIMVNPLERFHPQKNVYPKNVSADQELPGESSYVNTIQTNLQSNVHSKNSNALTRYEQGYNLPQISQIPNRTNRESIISSVNTRRTRDITPTQSVIISYQQSSNPDNTRSSNQQGNLRSQPNYPIENFELSQLRYQYSTNSTPPVYDGFENSDIHSMYTSDNPGGSSIIRGSETDNSVIANSPRTHSSNHEQINSYMHSYISNNNQMRKESPLDLSLRTVKTCADSTLNETDSETTLKTPQNKSTALKSAKQYPQFDVELFEKNLTQRSSQFPNIADPRYEFKPNFNLVNQSSKTNYPRGSDHAAFPKQTDTLDKQVFLNSVRYPTNKSIPPQPNLHSLVQSSKTTTKFKRNVTSVLGDRSVSNDTNFKKRRATDTSDCAIFNKIPKVADPWRKSIDMQIEERLSTYKQQQNKIVSNSFESSAYDSSPANREKSKEELDYSQKKSCEKVATSLPCVIQQSRPYSNNIVAHTYTSDLRSSSPSTNVKVQNNRFFGADKRVLNILRSSLEIKGKRKIEQQRAHVNSNHHFYADAHRPSVTDARPLLQAQNIKISAISSDAITNFTKENTISPLHTSQTGDYVNLPTDNITQSPRDSVEGHDNFAEFLAARIRTKGELKQGGSTIVANSNLFIDKPELEILENTIKSDLPGTHSESESSKIRQNLTQRKRVFSKNDEGNPSNFQERDKSEHRRSSETSVFDFPDSDSEREDKESLETMRKCRKSKLEIHHEIKTEPPIESSECHNEEAFTQLCDDFVEQLKNGFKKKPKRKKVIESKVSEEASTVPVDKSTDQDSINPSCEKQQVELETQITSNNILSENIHQIETNNNKMQLGNSPIDSSAELPMCVNKNDYVNEQQTNSIEEPIKTTNTKETEINERLECELTTKTEPSVIVKSENDNKVDEFETTVPMTQLNNGNKLKNELSNPPNSTNAISIIRPSKKPSFGDLSYFYPGWEEGVYKYKKSLRIPPTLIQISRPPQFHRLSTSLPDLDPYPQSPTVHSPNDNDNTIKITQIKSESLESDNESDYNYNVFGKKTNYDSESSASVLSSPNSTKELSILDKLLEKYGRNRERKYRRSELRQRRLEEAMKLLPSTNLEIKDELQKKKSWSPAVKQESTLLGYRKTTINTFVKSPSGVEDMNERLTAVIVKARTRKETRILKQRATIKEVFGEERPASAPPITFLNDLNFKKGIFDEDNCLGHLVIKLEKRDDMIDKIMQKQKKLIFDDDQLQKNNDPPKNILSCNEIKKEGIESELENLDDPSLKKYPVQQLDPQLVEKYENITRGRKKNRSGKMRRKLSSGFDYIRKKKKVKKEVVKSFMPSKKEKISAVEKAPESIHDIHKEIKTWVLNKGIGELHLHRAARLGYTDVTAYCLEKLNCNPSPKDNAGYTPLHEACARGHLDIAKLLLVYGANPSESAQGGVRPLHEACENGYVEISRLLLSYGADPTLVTYSGLTPLALTNDETTKNFLQNHLNDIEGEPSTPWILNGPASLFDLADTNGYNLLDNVPDADAKSVDEEIQFEVADKLLPNFYMLRNEPRTDRWILLQDLSSLLKIKSKDALLRQITQPSASNYKTVFKEMKMTEFLEQAQCCQFLNSGEKFNSRASKIALVKYTKKLRELLNIETISITR